MVVSRGAILTNNLSRELRKMREAASDPDAAAARMHGAVLVSSIDLILHGFEGARSSAVQGEMAYSVVVVKPGDCFADASLASTENEKFVRALIAGLDARLREMGLRASVACKESKSKLTNYLNMKMCGENSTWRLEIRSEMCDRIPKKSTLVRGTCDRLRSVIGGGRHQVDSSCVPWLGTGEHLPVRNECPAATDG